MKKLFLLLFSIILILACSSDNNNNSDSDPTDTDPDPVNIPEGMTGTAAIIDASGGEMEFSSPNGIIGLTIPSGALTSPTEITVYTLDDPKLDEIFIGLEPDGIEFQEPVRLNISLSQDLFTTHALTSMWNISDLNEVVDVGSEQHRWKRLANIEIGPSGQSISGEMEHFSTGLVLLGIQRVAYMVIDLPGKYLRPGDALFVLSGNSDFHYNWFPGHVGMVNAVSPNDGTLDGNLIVLESTLDGGPSDDLDGVQTNPFLKFKRTANHLYMGARRPTKLPVKYTDPDRQTTVQYARSRLGEGYGVLGGEDGLSCSNLVEISWDEADLGVFGTLDFFPSPVEMFEKTNRVSEISVKVGDEVKIPIYPVVIDKTSHVSFSTGFYNAGNPGVNATMTLVGETPEGSSWTIDNTHVYRARTFTWTPKVTDAGTTVTVNFRMQGSITLNAGYTKTYDISKHIDIHVLGAHTNLEITPVQMGQTGVIYNHYFPIPEGAVIGPSSNSHLIDTKTGAYPVNPIFPFQVLDSFEESWLNPSTNTHYGMSLHISRLDDPFDPPPKGSHIWSYYVDYEIPGYTGN